ncbi:MAG TPA: globin family protein [Pyrinomonadaceae bacterium]|nr:globin family protein [Pyrinomonadaceae bacterium]
MSQIANDLRLNKRAVAQGALNQEDAIMTNEQIKLVQDSFRQVAPIAETAAQLFYARLFELDPDLELLFKGNLSEQGRKLMQMLGLAVNSLDRMEQLLPAVQSLGTRHVSYGVRDKDYDTVGQALLWTLQKGLGEAFTPDVEAAWSEVYATLASAMQSGTEAPVGAVAIAEPV